MPSSVLCETTGSVTEVVLRTPGKGNALGVDAWTELAQAFAAVHANPHVRVAILRAEGPHFTYGLDLPAAMQTMGPLFQGGLADSRTRLHETVLNLQATVTALVDCKKPIVAAVHGACLGGGVDLITACDVRVCSRDARFSVREVRVAMVADLGTLQRLPRIVGEGHARELALTGRDFDANHALRIGLVTSVHDSPEATLEAARTLARHIAENPPLVVQGIKQVMNERVRREDDAGLRYVAAWNSAFLPSSDLGEALTAFVEKRTPHFEGR